ncbi:UFD1-domain-containing protein [Anaeromyces robustus]|uniref:Ubiquitin fusion degradation protein 1 n=1 Tax=Anaeromyces robustus TaxID=1754192 RepID=A0A1Y1VSR0_9FUNG|nr:UFD1-domain-containing protein [Anaeromyces robustus]|eukprot:ORX64065.1 UFD1-domain-containing protein [Anaeromyces robustus]
MFSMWQNLNIPQFANRNFEEYYRCYSTSFMQGNDKPDIHYGGKVIMPSSALDKLSRLNIAYPMLFELVNEQEDRKTHAGVLEFTAEEGRIYLPNWMMQTLLIEEGSIIKVKNTSLPLGTFVKIQPQSVDFLNIYNPKAVLEKTLTNFSALTEGDIITINYNDKFYDIEILEIKPKGPGISVVETDLEVDFAAPVGYKEPEPEPKIQSPHSSVPSSYETMSIDNDTIDIKKSSFEAFKGSGFQLNGKKKNSGASSSNSIDNKVKPQKVIDKTDPSNLKILRLPKGKLFFGYEVIPLKKEEEEEKPIAFTGTGYTLKAKKKNRKY